MKQRTYKIFKICGWVLFGLLVFFNIYNWYQIYINRVQIKDLPFQLYHNRIVESEDPEIISFFEDKIIISIDTLKVAFLPMEKKQQPFFSKKDPILERLLSNDEITIHWKDQITNDIGTYTVKPIKRLGKTELWSLIFNIFLVCLIFFNSYLLLRFSAVEENILIVFFLLFLAFPEEVVPLVPGYSINNLIIPLLGTLFYHFIVIKISRSEKIIWIYIVSLILALSSFFVAKRIELLNYFAYFWTLFWLLRGFILLGRSAKKTGFIELKRLSNAFRGFLITLVSGVVGVILGFIVYSVQGEFNPVVYNLFSYVMILLILISGLTFIVGILWFFGSFTWSLLTGTTMDVKIRSTLIFSIVGIVFVTIFGLIDYSLGEFLQNLFGNFIGSEFIAGIPATIGLLIFFNPIRSKVETVVDKRLNSSDLDFLTKTDSFSDNLSEEGIIEGFEEYICENLLHKLSIKKVALVSFDDDIHNFKFNEVRGSAVKENSIVEDIHEILNKNEVYRSFRVNENIQDIASFNMVLPIIHDDQNKWYLALGRKKDGTAYTRKDEDALLKLTERIKLSLKFILAYDDIANNKHAKEIKKLQRKIKEIRIENNNLREKIGEYEKDIQPEID